MNDFHKDLKNRGQGTKDWINTFTEIEYLGDDKFGASVTPGNRVFFDKADGNKPKKHKLTDDRPAKDCVLVQSAKCCVEVYPYYAKYYDVNHEEVRLYEERWVVQRLFKEPDDWRDVDAYNPIVTVEGTETGITVTITYDSDYGSLVVKYIQRDGAALKHDVVFTNTSGSTETFRVLQRWAGIAGSKCNGKITPIVEDTAFFAFHSSDKNQKKFNISENLWSMVFNPDRTRKTDHCLQLPVSIDTHAQGMKADFIYGNWVLVGNESLTIDPATATLDEPTELGYIVWDDPDYIRESVTFDSVFGYEDVDFRGYVEWDISSLANATLTANPIFKYEGVVNFATDEEINPITEEAPSVATDENLYSYIASGVAYVDPWNFQAGVGQVEVGLGESARWGLQNAMDALQSWFAFGFQSPDDEGGAGILVSALGSPILYVEYTPAPEGTVKYYFNSYDEFNAWANNPENMVDGATNTFANSGGDILQANDGNTCPGDDLGTITKVELRFLAYASDDSGDDTVIHLDPQLGDDHFDALTEIPSYSSWFDITSDLGAPSPWTWTDIQDLVCDVTSGSDAVTYYCSKVEIRITYTTVTKGAMQTGKYWGQPI